jgi:hypothetical protein
MANESEIIQKLGTIHADIKNTNEKIDSMNKKVNALDIMLRGDGTSVNIGLVAKVSEHSRIFDDVKKIEKKVAILVIVLAIILFGGWESAKAIVKMLIHI